MFKDWLKDTKKIKTKEYKKFNKERQTNLLKEYLDECDGVRECTCGGSMVCGREVWAGQYVGSTQIDATLGVFTKRSSVFGGVYSIYPDVYVCPDCGRMELVVSEEDREKYLTMLLDLRCY